MVREHLGLTPDEIAPMVAARTGAEILAYENDEDDLLVAVLWTIWKLLLEICRQFNNYLRIL